MDLTYSSNTLQSLETNQTNNLGTLSEELLAHSDVLKRNSSLGSLYNDTIEYGDPLADADYWRQQDGANSCAVVAQISVYESFTGETISEADAVDYAYQQEWLDSEIGTLPKDMDNTLEYLGIKTYLSYDTSFAELEDALARGDKAIVAVDSSEIWSPQYDRRGNSLDQSSDADHAVWVTGIDYESNGSVNIILNDSGIPDGSASVVEYDDFMNAWEDLDFFAAIAENPFA